MSWDSSASISTLLTHSDIQKASNEPHTPDASTPILALSAQARSKGYDLVCLPLTTEKWKTRWTEMCLLPTGTALHADMAAEKRAEVWRANPGFLRDEVTITQLGILSHFLVLIGTLKSVATR
jgi:protein arginine N-methyltransferase 5